MLQTITAPADRAVRVTVFEPRQREDQEEVKLDEFELLAGESRDYDFKSATAAYRSTPLTVRTPEEERLSMNDTLTKQVETMKREDEERLKAVGNRRGAFAEQIDEEIEAGKAAHAANKRAMGAEKRAAHSRGEGSEAKAQREAEREERKEAQETERQERQAAERAAEGAEPKPAKEPAKDKRTRRSKK